MSDPQDPTTDPTSTSTEGSNGETESLPRSADKSPKAELFEAIDHFKSAASLFFDRAAKSAPMKRATDAVDDAMGKIDPRVRDVTAKADDFVSKNIDPAFDSASKEAERVIKKIGDAAEPLARQLASELGKLTKKFGTAMEGEKRKKAPPEDSDPKDR